MFKQGLFRFTVVLFLISLTGCQPLIVDQKAPRPAPVQIELQPASTQDRAAATIFAEISPSVAFLETPAGTGSGVLIEHGYLLSNAHVVWPFDKVRVVFPNGKEYKDTPVLAWDLMADLALIGPLDVELPPVKLVDGSKLEIGSDIYLIGYPAEVEEFPQPAITNGILSRVRTWDAIHYSFFQVDATTVGGQSGGIMVTHAGDVVGVSTFYYGGFGLAGSVADTITRINAMLGNPGDVLLDRRPFNTGASSTKQTGTLRSDWDSQMYILNEPIDTEVELRVEGVGKPHLSVSSLAGYFVDASDADEENVAELTFTVEEAGPYVIEVTQPSQNENTFDLTSSHPLAPYIDPDDGRSIAIGDTIAASMDTSSDADHYELPLKKGDIVQITVDALEVDPELTLTYHSRALEEVVTDDDSGGGIFGNNAQITYKAPADDTYSLVVRNYEYSNVGSYFLTVTQADADAELTEPSVTRELFTTGFGAMTWYKSEEYDFAVLYPTFWTEVAGSRCAPGAIVCYTGPGVMIITEDILTGLPKKERNHAGYLALLEDNLKLNPAVELGPFEPITTLQKLAADELSFTAQAGRATGKRLIYVDEEQQVAFNVTIVLPTEVYSIYEPMLQLIFDSFRSWHDKDQDKDAVYHLDQGWRLAANEDWTGAIDAYDQSIALDPTLTPAYERRAWMYYRLKDREHALADIQHALELAPKDERYHYDSAMLYWNLQDYEAALDAINTVIKLKPEQSASYNQRALIQVFLGDYEAALADLETYQELNNDELSPSALDTRGFIYLMMGDFAKAKADYEETYHKDFRSAYTLLGGGIVYAELGDNKRAQALLEEGFQKVENQKVEQPDPQLSELIERAKALREK